MDKSDVVEFNRPAGINDPVTEVLRQGAHKLLAQAIEAGFQAFLAGHSALTTSTGHRRIVRNGYLPEREIRTGVGIDFNLCPAQRGVRHDPAQGADEYRIVTARRLARKINKKRLYKNDACGNIL